MPLATRDPIVIGSTFEELVEKLNLLLTNGDFNIEDIVGAMVGPGSTQNGITVSYDSINHKLDFDVSGGGGGGDVEFIQDTVGPMFAHGGHTGITATYNDVTGLVTLSVVDNFVNTSGDTMTGDLNLNSAARLIKNQVSSFGASAVFADAGVVVGPNATTGLAIGRDAIKTNGGTLTLGSISNHDVLFLRQNVEYARLTSVGITSLKPIRMESTPIEMYASGTKIGTISSNIQALEIKPEPSRAIFIRGVGNNVVFSTATQAGNDSAQLYYGGAPVLQTTNYGLNALGSNIRNVATPADPTDAVPKSYVDAALPKIATTTTVLLVNKQNAGLAPNVNTWTNLSLAGIPNAAPGRLAVMHVFMSTRSEPEFIVSLRRAAGYPQIMGGICWSQDEVDSIFTTVFVEIGTGNTIQWMINAFTNDSVVMRLYCSGVVMQ